MIIDMLLPHDARRKMIEYARETGRKERMRNGGKYLSEQTSTPPAKSK